MKKLLLISYEWSLRLLLAFILMLSAMVLSLTFIDFYSIEKHILPLQLVKATPRKVKNNVWIGPYLYEEKLLKFIQTNRINVVVALLDENMNHERSLIEGLKELLKEKGIKFFVISTKPFVKDKGVIRRIKRILKINKDKRIYIHSYLGRVRVKLVEEALYVGKDP